MRTVVANATSLIYYDTARGHDTARGQALRAHQRGQVLQSSKLGQASKCAIVPDAASIDRRTVRALAHTVQTQ